MKLKARIIGRATDDGCTKVVEIAVPLKYLSNSWWTLEMPLINCVPLKYLSNFWRTPEMPVINCEINLPLVRSENCVITNSIGSGVFAIILYVPVVALLTLDSTKLLEQLKSGFKQTINWNKYYLELKTFEQRNRYLNHLIDPCFQGVNRLCYHLKIKQADQDTQDIIFKDKRKK